MPNPSVPTISGLDLADAMARLDLSFEEFKALLAVFPAAVRAETAKLEAAMAGGDPDAVRFGAHALAGLAGNYGAKELWAAAKALESAVLEGRTAQVPVLWEKIGPLARQASQGVEQIL